MRGQSALVLSLCESFYAAVSSGAATQHSGGRAAGSTAASRLLVNRHFDLMASSTPQDCCASGLRGPPYRCCLIPWFPREEHCPSRGDKFCRPARDGRRLNSVRPHPPYSGISEYQPARVRASSPVLQRYTPFVLLTAWPPDPKPLSPWRSMRPGWNESEVRYP